ncbi:DUF4150 domain-containing protein [Desulfatiglans anilini]|uniref:DUF4150 domain-containing protein n=1 Tax=Desulfatiglans anilini TaxID=90728 RepID=UPI0003F9D63E|nr:DUF4150 domain-containing protein [Desulfatiglans anilini]
MFANTQMMGMDMAFPDVCLTPAPPAPPIPVPYPNIAMGPTANPGTACKKTFIMCMPAHNLGTMIPMTNGDNPGVSMGVASGTVMGPQRHLTGAFTVLFEGMPATRLTSASIQNSTNAPGMRLVPSQTKVILLAP